MTTASEGCVVWAGKVGEGTGTGTHLVKSSRTAVCRQEAVCVGKMGGWEEVADELRCCFSRSMFGKEDKNREKFTGFGCKVGNEGRGKAEAQRSDNARRDAWAVSQSNLGWHSHPD